MRLVLLKSIAQPSYISLRFKALSYKRSQLSNSCSSVSISGISTLVKQVQLAKDLNPRYLTFFRSIIERALQQLKASYPTLVNL